MNFPYNSTKEVFEKKPLGEQLHAILVQLESLYSESKSPTLGDLLHLLGDRAVGLGSAMIAFPFLTPFSVGPLTAPGSLAIIYLAWHLWSNKEEVTLPKKVRDAHIPRAVFRLMRKFMTFFVWMVERISRQRPSRFVTGSFGRRFTAAWLIIGAVLLAVPIPVLPLTNTFPAAGIALVALGYVEKDHRLLVLGIVTQFLGALILAGVFGAVLFLGIGLSELMSKLFGG